MRRKDPDQYIDMNRIFPLIDQNDETRLKAGRLAYNLKKKWNLSCTPAFSSRQNYSKLLVLTKINKLS